MTDLSHSDDKDIQAIPVPGKNATLEDYQEALKIAQLQVVGKHQTALQKICTLVGTLQSNQQSHRKGPKTVKKHDEEISMLGHKCSVMVPHPVIEANSPNRYLSEMSTKQGVVADLHDLVPPKLHKMMQKYSPFAQKFRAALSGSCSSIIHHLRGSITKIFPSSKADYFQIDFKGYEDLPEFQAYLKFDATKSSYPTFAPILYPNLKKNDKKLFQSMILVHARFIVSPNIRFEQQGAHSRINYQKDFNRYKEILIKGAQRPNLPSNLMHNDNNEERDEFDASAILAGMDAKDVDNDDDNMGVEISDTTNILSSLGLDNST
ncbi:hypothetical protein HETIRDRAFT_429463 [Heterobasidion irregulare TC 32-1]|uniref:Uncharacterized protein n=1 Tax=Heterobasidion irregulare (strain TC 32-1) TaxID=747525 RepID=W4JU87_HETIT|nr:uncharacterized protein HETIRDRAFT_429463 [Heterobasidion irregulare TC 32-1]ETW77118.1 hypothetical protein HETIRDRAFT_429463 [Heterobasidion irregulare TC 32-1]